MTKQITFPRELSDELAELIATRARICGAGAFDFWEAMCEQANGASSEVIAPAVPETPFTYMRVDVDGNPYRCNAADHDDAFPVYRRPGAQPQGEGEPVAWQYMTHPTWDRGAWPSKWNDCTKEAHDDYVRVPMVADWEYRTRKLYAEQAAPVAVVPDRDSLRDIDPEKEMLRHEVQRLWREVADLKLDKSWRDNPDSMGR